MDTWILGTTVLGKAFTVAKTHAPSLPAFRAEASALARTRGKGIPQLAHDLGIAEQALRGWMQRADSDAGRGQPGDLTTDEREELRRLRREHHLLKQERAIVQSRGLLRAGDLVRRWRFLQAERANYPVTILCRALHLARSGDDAWARRRVSARATADQVLTDQIALIHERSRHTYGTPRVHAALRASGIRCGSRRVARLMRAAGLAGRHRRQRIRTTIPDPARVPAPNRVAHDCTAAGPDRLWIGDITSIATWEGWALPGGAARRALPPRGRWAMADHLRAELALNALAMARGSRRPVYRRCLAGGTRGAGHHHREESCRRL